MNFLDSQTSYEAWLRALPLDLDTDALQKKQEKMREGVFPFLRATFYRWIQLWLQSQPGLSTDVPRVSSVGDIHLENFGLWRDLEGRLVWGVNDLDEACLLPYTHDLVRLAVSAALANLPDTKGKIVFTVSPAEACASLWQGYKTAIAGGRAGACPILLDNNEFVWLNSLAQKQLATSVDYYDKELGNKKKMAPLESPLLVPQAAREALLSVWPEPVEATALTWYRRTSGMGSLGRPRYAASGTWKGGAVIREVKALVPSAYYWAKADPSLPPTSHTQEILTAAIHSPAPFYRVIGAWTVRRIAPDCEKLEIEDWPAENLRELLEAMGRELANIHLGGASAATQAMLQAHVKSQPPDWLATSVPAFVTRLTDDFQTLPSLPKKGKKDSAPK